MRHSPLRDAALATGAALSVLALVALPAAADTAGGIPVPKDTALAPDLTLQEIQAAAQTDISNRVASLNAAVDRVRSATDLGADQGALLGTLQGDLSGLPELGQTISADTSVASAKSDFQQIFSGFRVYALVLPTTALVSADDHVTNTTAPKLTADASRIAAKETPTDQAQLQPLLSDLATKVSAATAAVGGQAAALEADTPAEWNANHDLLSAATTATRSAAGDMAQARSDAQQAAADVGATVGHRGGAEPGTTAPST